MNWFVHSLKNYANFSGRANRREWWIFWLAFCFPAVLLLTLEHFSSSASTESQKEILAGFLLIGAVLVFVWNLALLVPYFAVTVRRLHDIGLSGWWLLIVFVPIIGAIFFVVVTLMRGHEEENAYGNVPTVGWVPRPPDSDGLISTKAALAQLKNIDSEDPEVAKEAMAHWRRYQGQRKRRFGRSQCFFVTKDFATVTHGRSPDYAITRFRMSEVVAVTREHHDEDEYSVVVTTTAGEITMLLSEEVSADFTSKLFEQLSQQDQDEAVAAKFFTSNLTDHHALDPQAESAASSNAWANYQAGLALEHGINCSVNFDAALAFYLQAYQSIPEKDEFLNALARATRLADKVDDLVVPLPSSYIFESQHSALRLLKASVQADNVAALTEEDAAALASSGIEGKSTLSLMTLGEISDLIAERLTRYKGKAIRLNPNVKMSEKASLLLSKLVAR